MVEKLSWFNQAMEATMIAGEDAAVSAMLVDITPPGK
jgi:hypothetical protein